MPILNTIKSKGSLRILVVVAIVIAVSLFFFLRKKPSSGVPDPAVVRAVIKGELVVAFQKQESELEAVRILKKTGLKFRRTEDINMGRYYAVETGPKFIVYVPLGQEDTWEATLKKNNAIVLVNEHYDPSKLILD
jgi:hypothetical protein